MAEKTLTVGELRELLKGLPSDTPLYLQDVRTGGVTYRLPIMASEGDPADGKLVWIWVKGAAEPPQWMASGLAGSPLTRPTDWLQFDRLCAEVLADADPSQTQALWLLRFVRDQRRPKGGDLAQVAPT